MQDFQTIIKKRKPEECHEQPLIIHGFILKKYQNYFIFGYFTGNHNEIIECNYDFWDLIY